MSDLVPVPQDKPVLVARVGIFGTGKQKTMKVLGFDDPTEVFDAELVDEVTDG